jgi:hypothetical protein
MPTVIVINGSKVPIEWIENVNILSNNISDVLYLPSFTSNLLSVSKIIKKLIAMWSFHQKIYFFSRYKNEKNDWWRQIR